MTSALTGSLRQTGGRGIVSAGCEITPGTSIANMRAFRTTAGG
jgi:uroporphyrinogen-III decarboxylase